MTVGDVDTDFVHVLVYIDLYGTQDARIVDICYGGCRCHLLVIPIGDRWRGVLKCRVQPPHCCHKRVVRACPLEQRLAEHGVLP